MIIRETAEPDLEEIFNQPDSVVLFHLLAESSGSVVGSVVVSPIAMQPDMGLFCGAIAPLSVLPNQQSSGIGSDLIKAAIGESKKLE